MADFPAGIRPTTITPQPGSFPGVDHTTIAGNLRNYQSGNRITGARLSLSFRNTKTTTIAALRAHWDGEQTHNAWRLSSELLDGLEYAAEYAALYWRYAGPYRITDYTSESGGVHDAEVELVQALIPAFIDPLIVQPATGLIHVGGTVRLVGPGAIPELWTSRLATAQRFAIGNGGSVGSAVSGPDGTSFQVFWFEPTSGTMVRLVVVKRDINGLVLWQRWTSAEFGMLTTSRNAYAPQVLPLPDGGCVVFTVDDNELPWITSVLTMRGWRLSASGAQIWAKDYSGNILGAYRVALNDSQVIVYTASRLAGVSGNPLAPTLLQISLADGSYTGGNNYRINNTTSSLHPTLRDSLLVLPSGAMILKAVQTTLMEITSNGATVNKTKVFSSSGSCLDGGITLLPNGSYLCRHNRDTMVQIAADFSVNARYKYTGSIGFAGGTLLGEEAFGMAIAADASGNIYHLAVNEVGIGYLSTSGTQRGVKITKLANNGGSIVGYSEISFGPNIGELRSGQLAQGSAHGIDITKERGIVHLLDGFEATCRVTAIGFSLSQPAGTGANNIPAATLDTGSCTNTMGVRSYTPSYGIGSPDSITSTTGSAGVASVSITVNNGSLNMIDASASLSWTRKALIF
jgi:hypothetical protein